MLWSQVTLNHFRVASSTLLKVPDFIAVYFCQNLIQPSLFVSLSFCHIGSVFTRTLYYLAISALLLIPCSALRVELYLFALYVAFLFSFVLLPFSMAIQIQCSKQGDFQQIIFKKYMHSQMQLWKGLYDFQTFFYYTYFT